MLLIFQSEIKINNEGLENFILFILFDQSPMSLLFMYYVKLSYRQIRVNYEGIGYKYFISDKIVIYSIMARL